MLLDHFKVFRVFFRLIEFSSGVVENAGVFGWHIEGLNIRLISKIPIRKLFILTSSFHPCVVFYDLAKNNKMAKYCFFLHTGRTAAYVPWTTRSGLCEKMILNIASWHLKFGQAKITPSDVTRGLAKKN